MRAGTRMLGVTRGRQGGAWSGEFEIDRGDSVSSIGRERRPLPKTDVEIARQAFAKFSSTRLRPAKLVAPISRGVSRWRETTPKRDLSASESDFAPFSNAPLLREGRKDRRAATL
jgi:hypothetical protein